jgi:hypothetical protein
MKTFDLCLAWNWKYDADFIHILEIECVRQNCSLLQITPENLEDRIHTLGSEEISFRAFFDRASDADPQFQSLEEWVRQHRVFQLNPREQTLWTHDKTAVHLAFYESGLATPYTYLLPRFTDQPELPILDLQLLGGRFAIKPATGGGGGEGVVLEAISIEQVETERRKNPENKYLIQAQLDPYYLEGRQAWFRILVCNGISFPCWWDTQTHRYTAVTTIEIDEFKLTGIYEIAKKIITICKMDLFSFEIALIPSGQFLVVDYLNDPIDLRLQTKAMDGVPDEIVHQIATELVTRVKTNLREYYLSIRSI